MRNDVALLFRQMDGGELYYENVIFDPLWHLDDAKDDTMAKWRMSIDNSRAACSGRQSKKSVSERSEEPKVSLVFACSF